MSVSAGDQVLLAGPPLLGGIYTAPSGVAAPVKLELPWRSGYRLDQLVVGLEPDGGPARITFPAVRPQHAGEHPGATDADRRADRVGRSGGDGTMMMTTTKGTPNSAVWRCVYAPKTARSKSA